MNLRFRLFPVQMLDTLMINFSSITLGQTNPSNVNMIPI